MRKFSLGDQVRIACLPHVKGIVVGMNTNLNLPKYDVRIIGENISTAFYEDQIEKDDSPTPPSPKYKIGDMIKVINPNFYHYKRIMKVTEVANSINGLPSYKIYEKDLLNSCWVMESDIERASVVYERPVLVKEQRLSDAGYRELQAYAVWIKSIQLPKR